MWESRGAIQVGKLEHSAAKPDPEVQGNVERAFSVALSYLSSEAASLTKRQSRALATQLLSIKPVKSCVDLGVVTGGDRDLAGLIRAMSATETIPAKSLLLLHLMAAQLVPDKLIAPLKSHPAAKTKVNVKLCDVLAGAKKYFSDSWNDLAQFSASFFGMSNDQFSGWVMWFIIAHQVDSALACRISECARDMTMLKDLSTTIKALGLNSTERGSLCCELNTLIGRGSLPGDADDDVRTRIRKKDFLEEKAAVLDHGALRAAVKKVIAEEMVVQPRWVDPDTYWTRRWMYTKSGSHTRHIEDVVFGQRLDLPEQPTRREFAEAIKDNLVAIGSPEVWAGLSWKLENGKTRAIYGCDSRSYFTFDYLLRPVEAVWRNKVALLNPGVNLQSTLYPFLAKEGPYYYMLDFDDYNSQHTLEAMKIVIEEATVGAPEHVRNWAISSWDSMYVRWISSATGKLTTEKMVGTLPSGHRATTFVNTILNAAYCRVVMGDDYDKVQALHAGDDVIMWGPDTPLSSCIASVERSPLRVNRSKQSIGNVSGEFLRVAFNKKEAFGYLGRAISSTVSGNWVTEAKVSPRSYLDNFSRLGWTLANRSRVRNAGALLTYSLQERLGVDEQTAYEICTCRVSVGASPIMDDEPNDWTMLDISGGNAHFGRVDAGSACHATEDYLHNHVDMKLLEGAGVNPGALKALMLKASYKPREDPEIKTMRIKKLRCPYTVQLGLVTAIHFKKRETTTNTAISLLEGLMSGVDWRFLVSKIRGTDASILSITGKSEWPVGSPIGVPYGDNMSLRDRFTTPTLVKPLYRIYA
jgi:hypothetical protein